MTIRTFYLVGDGTDPYENLALEDALLRAVPEGGLLLYLWQNAHTVVIGKNQNCFAECDLPLLEAEGGRLARRASGGGAVYHDLGNLNFTFLACDGSYDVSRQLEIILRALRSLGIPAGRTGRNDIAAGERKISGNAFRSTGGRSCHHGTLLWNVDLEKLSRYLRPSAAKLAAKGVPSVRSRVGNLTDFVPALTLDALRSRLIQSLAGVYGSSPEPFPMELVDFARLRETQELYSSPGWLYGRVSPAAQPEDTRHPSDILHPPDTPRRFVRRFHWGDIDLRLTTARGRVERAEVFSDALDADRIARIPALLMGCECSPSALADRLRSAASGGEDLPEYADIADWLEE